LIGDAHSGDGAGKFVLNAFENAESGDFVGTALQGFAIDDPAGFDAEGGDDLLGGEARRAGHFDGFKTRGARLSSLGERESARWLRRREQGRENSESAEGRT